MDKRITLIILFAAVLVLLCGAYTGTDVIVDNTEQAILIKARKKIKKKEFSRIISDQLIEDKTLSILYTLYQLPAKDKCVYSVGGVFNYKEQIECKYYNVTGRKPLLYGVETTYALDDYWSLFNHAVVPSGKDINQNYKDFLVESIKKAYDLYGSIPVIAYHMANPYSPIPPERYGAYHEYKDNIHKNVIQEMRLGKGESCGYNGKCDNPRVYLDEKLDSLASFVRLLIDKKGKPIPCIIRPFHEMDMNSFWWGESFCSPDDYIWLFRYTVDKLRKSYNIHNIIWGYNLGNRFTSYDKMIERYPGDDYVDIIGCDEYNMGYSQQWTKDSYTRCRLITEESLKRNKVCGLFECGVAGIKEKEDILNRDFYTTGLPQLLDQDGIKLSFVLGYEGTYMPSSDEGKKNYRTFVRSKRIYNKKLR